MANHTVDVINQIFNQYLKEHPDAVAGAAPATEPKEQSNPITYKDLTVDQRNLLMLGRYRKRDLKKMQWRDWFELNLMGEEAKQDLKNKCIAGQSKDMLAKAGASETQIAALTTRKEAEALWKSMQRPNSLSLFQACRFVYKHEHKLDDIKHLTKVQANILLDKMKADVVNASYTTTAGLATPITPPAPKQTPPESDSDSDRDSNARDEDENRQEEETEEEDQPIAPSPPKKRKKRRLKEAKHASPCKKTNAGRNPKLYPSSTFIL